MLRISVVPSLAAVSPQAFAPLEKPGNPFATHAFLHTLERSNSVGTAASGWWPQHVLVHADTQLVGAVPFYGKDHSYGEFIFDWAWAAAAQRAGLAYYPKMVAAIPFTPATGQRLLVHRDATAHDAAAIVAALLQGMQQAASACQATSIHVLFCPAAELPTYRAATYQTRLSWQFHWHNDAGWHHFDDFLAALRAPTRKQVRRERAAAQAHGLRLGMYRGAQLSSADIAALEVFYRQTVHEKGGETYLQKAFFPLLQSTLAPYVVAALAHQGTQPVAGALFFCDATHLYGRYWGTAMPDANGVMGATFYNALHFELCYYLPIAWCLQHGMTHFEAGAQGEHKLKRGLLPAPCYSAHWLAHAGLATAVGHFLKQEKTYVEADMAAYASHTPYKRDSLTP